jgi:Ca-activated chloride channel family protein
MQQIRLRGEDPELVQSIVNLSTHYGVITPYTSFLIEEDDIFAQSNGAPTIEAAEFLAAPAEVSGAAAVDRAAVEGELSMAEAPAPLATIVATDASGNVVSQAPVRTAGSRTFFLRGGVWVDSAYDGTAEPKVIPFASDTYFDLLSKRPELGEALALGEEMILILDGVAYRITAEGGTPDAQSPTGGPATPIAGDGGIAQVEPTPAATDGYLGATSVGVQVCGLGVLLPLAVLGGWGFSRRRKA